MDEQRETTGPAAAGGGIVSPGQGHLLTARGSVMAFKAVAAGLGRHRLERHHAAARGQLMALTRAENALGGLLTLARHG